MGSRYHQRPENAIAKADEFIKVGKTSRALDTLYDVFKSKKRYHTYSEKLIEQIMFKYLELCVDLRKSHIAKEGLFQYRNMCQLTNVASLASVVQGYLNLAEQRTEAARQESVESAAEVDDLDNLNTPEMIMLSAVSGEDAQDRSDRKILMPWVKFLWESYCQCLELLRTNIRVERLYHDIAQQAFRFCLKYQRKTEFRKLCDKLRNHLELVLKQTPSQMSINLNNAETQQMNLDTRLAQLDAAIQMELWQEAYKAVEDIHGLMTMSKKVFQPKMMANYYQKLALVFWKSGNQLFHAAAIFKHFQLTREMKKNISPEEQGKMASRVLAACLAVPVPSQHPEFDKFIETDRTPQEKMARLAVLLSLQQPPTRISLLKDAVRFGVVQAATQPLQDLHRWLEVDFHPLKLCRRVQDTLKVIEESEEKAVLAQYMQPLRDITLVRLLKQVSQVYQSICFNKLLSLAPFTNNFELERVIVDCVRHNDMQIRVDHRTRTVHFGSNMTEAQSVSEVEGPHLQDMPSEQVRTQLMLMLEVLDKSIKTINPDKMKIENEALRQKIFEAYHHHKDREHTKILQRKYVIEQHKEGLEKRASIQQQEEQKKQEELLAKQQKEENERLKAEVKEREEKKIEDQLKAIQEEHKKARVDQIRQTALGSKILQNLAPEDIVKLDNDKIIVMQVEQMENEKKQLQARLKAQEKRLDHIERAKRQEEIPLLKEAMQKDMKDDMEIWAAKEEDRIKQAVADREEAVNNRDRLARMKNDKEEFMSTLLKQRKDLFDKKLKEYNKMIDQQRAVRLEERKQQRMEDRRAKWYREKEEEEQRLRDEALKREREEKERKEAERKAREEEAYRKKKEELDAIQAKQMEREREIEAKLAKESEDARRAAAAAAEREDKDKEDGGGNWRRGGGGERKEGGGERDGAWRRPHRDERDDGVERQGEGRGGGGGWRGGQRDGGGGGSGWRERVRQKDEEWGPRRDDGPRRRDDDGPRRRDDEGGFRRRDDDGFRRRQDDDGPRRRDDDGPRRREDDADNWRSQPRGEQQQAPPERDVRRDRDDRGPRGGGPPRGERRFDNEGGRADNEGSWRRAGGGPDSSSDQQRGGGGRDGPDRRMGGDRRMDGDRRGPPRGDRDERRGGGFGDRDGGGGGSWRDRPRGGQDRDERGPPRRDDRDRRGGGGNDSGNWRRDGPPAGPPRRDDRRGDDRRPPPRDDRSSKKEGGGDEDGDWQTVSRR